MERSNLLGRSGVSAHIFVDETKDRGYLIAAAVLVPRDLGPARTELRQLLLRGQSRIHFKKERDSRRHIILSKMVTLGAKVTIYDASAQCSEGEARASCLEATIADAADLGAHRLVLEQDDSWLERDRKLLYQQVRKAGCAETLTYEHMRPSSECLLWIPDAIAWCWAKGGDWKRRVAPMISTVRTL
jgi:hypothetical protein